MKKLINIILGILFFVGCWDNNKFGFISSNCNEVYSNCMNKCVKKGLKRSDCFNSCDKSRGMCASIKVKGCMQDCNSKYKKGTQNAEICKQRCVDNNGL